MPAAVCHKFNDTNNDNNYYILFGHKRQHEHIQIRKT